LYSDASFPFAARSRMIPATPEGAKGADGVDVRARSRSPRIRSAVARVSAPRSSRRALRARARQKSAEERSGDCGA
jgi:hypothetical protein